jgi:hypothetical protein
MEFSLQCALSTDKSTLVICRASSQYPIHVHYSNGLPMDEGRERDNTSRKGGPPTLPGLYRSTIQPS